MRGNLYMRRRRERPLAVKCGEEARESRANADQIKARSRTFHTQQAPTMTHRACTSYSRSPISTKSHTNIWIITHFGTFLTLKFVKKREQKKITFSEPFFVKRQLCAQKNLRQEKSPIWRQLTSLLDQKLDGDFDEFVAPESRPEFLFFVLFLSLGGPVGWSWPRSEWV